MQLKTIVGCYELVEVQGVNSDVIYKLTIPANFTWETLHSAIANMANAAKEWEELNKKKAEEAQAAQAAEEVTAEVVA